MRYARICKKISTVCGTDLRVISIRFAIALAEYIVGGTGTDGLHQVMDQLKVTFVVGAEGVGECVGVDGVSLLTQVLDMLRLIPLHLVMVFLQYFPRLQQIVLWRSLSARHTVNDDSDLARLGDDENVLRSVANTIVHRHTGQ